MFERIETVVGAKACCVLFMRALLLLLLLLLLLCVTERKSLKTDVVSSTGQNTKKRGPRERVSSSQFRVSFFRFFDLFDSFFVFFILNFEKGILLVNYSYS